MSSLADNISKYTPQKKIPRNVEEKSLSSTISALMERPLQHKANSALSQFMQLEYSKCNKPGQFFQWVFEEAIFDIRNLLLAQF